MVNRLLAMVTMNRGVAVVLIEEWNRLVALEKIYDSIAECLTWGDYRSLGYREFDGQVLEMAELEEFPSKNEPFDIDLRERMGDEGPTLESSLESATFDFFESVDDVEIEEEDLESWALGLGFVSRPRKGSSQLCCQPATSWSRSRYESTRVR